jgi:hypothetical protein
MEIKMVGRMDPVCVQLPCALCAAPFELAGGDPVFIAYGDGGEPVGRVCPGCALAGESGLERRLSDRIERLNGEARRLEDLIRGGIRISRT